MTLIRDQKFNAAEKLAYQPRDDLWIVEDNETDLYVMCGRCEHRIFYDSGFGGSDIWWKCSNEAHGKAYSRKVPVTPVPGSDVQKSTASLFDGDSFLERWAAYWLDVPREDIQIKRL